MPCQWIEVDGIKAHVNGDLSDPESEEAILAVIRAAAGLFTRREDEAEVS